MWRTTGLEHWLTERRRVLWGYFDESGKFADSDFVCLAGYLAGEQWDRFCYDWRTTLGERRNGAAIHTASINWKNPEEVEALNEFARIIRRHSIYGFSVAVDADYYRKMSVEKRKLLGNKDPRDFTFHRLLRIMCDRLRDDGQDDWLSIIFDYEEGFSVECLRSLIKLRMQLPFIKNLVRHIGFADDEIFYPLQAADMFAYAHKRSLRDASPAYWDVLTQPATKDNPAPPCLALYYGGLLLEQECDELRRRTS